MKAHASFEQVQNVIYTLIVVVGLLIGSFAYANEGQEKVTVCHKGSHEITIGEPAVAAHLNHGDTVGSCDDGGGGPSPV